MDVVVTHVNADFDALGGLVGAGRLYPGSVLVLPGGESPGVHDFLSLHREVLAPRVPAEIDPEAIRRIIVVDACSRKRLGLAAAWLDLPGVEVHLWDHHLGADCDLKADFQRIEPWGSVSSVVTHCLKERHESLTAFEATAILMGIYEDTGSLSYGGTRPEDLEAAAWLLRNGADLDVVAEFARRGLTPEQRRLLQHLLSRLEIHEVRGTPVAISTAPTGPYVEDAAMLVPRILDAEDVPVGFILVEMEETLYLIGRSRTHSADVAAVIREMGGGGHARAASVALKDEPLDQAKQRLLQMLERYIVPERTAADLMSYPVRTISPDATIGEGRRRMLKYGHSGLMVMERGELVGVITRRDIDKARHHGLEHAPIRGFMTRDVATVAPEASLSMLEQTMIREGIGRLPVVRNGVVVGIVTRTDVLEALHGRRYLAGAPPLDEEPVVQLMREHLPARIQTVLERVGEVADGVQAQAYVVGGFVRDLLLGVRNLDLDLLVEPDGAALAQAVAEALDGELFKVESAFRTAKVRLRDGLEIDFATARTESYARPGALPEVEPSSISDDLRRRDFTINAMAISLLPQRFGELLDPFGGRRDLDRRRLRVLHAVSFIDDPTRIFRAVRFEDRFHVQMDRHTEEKARHAIQAGALETITPERLRRQLEELLMRPRPVGGLLRLQELGVFAQLAPGLELDVPLLQSIPGAADWWVHLTDEPLGFGVVYLAGILLPLGPEAAVEVAETRLRVNGPDLKAFEAAVKRAGEAARLLDLEAKPAALTALLRPLPPEALVLIAASGAACSQGDRVRAVLERFLGQWRHVKLEIGGADLRAEGFIPGPAFGQALDAALDARLNGELKGREAELEFAVRELQRAGCRRKQADR